MSLFSGSHPSHVKTILHTWYLQQLLDFVNVVVHTRFMQLSFSCKIRDTF